VNAEEFWLASTWPFVEASLPSPPARVLEIGCGPLGGFVPELLARGYDAVGVDPLAPATAGYAQSTFEEYEPAQRLEAVVASTSLHHVTDLGAVVDRIADVLTPLGVLVVVEWSWEQFDEATARWCFARLPDSAETGWLAHHRRDWAASGDPWDAYLSGWARGHHLHSSTDIVQELDRNFDRQSLAGGPYCFQDLEHTSPDDEQAAIDAGTIQPTCVRYLGQRS